MNKTMERKVAKTVVTLAAKTAKLPNQFCLLFLGKPNTEMDLTIHDYENLENFIKTNPQTYL